MKFLVKKAPEHFLRTVNDEINALLNRHFDTYFPEAAYQEEFDKFSLPVEIEEKDNLYKVKAEIPGIDKENLNIEIEKNSLIISAKKYEEKSDEQKTYKKSEFHYGEFSRTIYFSDDIDIENTKAKLSNGILKIEAPKLKTEKEQKKKLEIE